MKDMKLIIKYTKLTKIHEETYEWKGRNAVEQMGYSRHFEFIAHRIEFS